MVCDAYVGKVSSAGNQGLGNRRSASFGPGTFKSLAMGDNMTQYGNFHSGVTRHFQMVQVQETYDHNLETKKVIQTLYDMNSKRNVTSDTGVAKLKEEQSQALKDHVEDIMACF
jgi:hypothetical protein